MKNKMSLVKKLAVALLAVFFLAVHQISIANGHITYIEVKYPLKVSRESQSWPLEALKNNH